jgi:hypothetical protein
MRDGSDAEPKSNGKSGTSLPGSPWTPLGGYRLKREPNPLKIGNHRVTKIGKVKRGFNPGRIRISQEVGRSRHESRCSPHDPFGVGLRQAHDNSRDRRTTQRETGNAGCMRNKRKIQRS